MTTLDRGFEDALADAVLPDQDETIELGEDLRDRAEAYWDAYMAEHDYDIEHITREATVEDVSVGSRERSVTVTWPFSSLFEHGVDPHVIRASSTDYLAFEWPAPPEGTRPEGAPAYVRTDEVDWGSETGGIPKARAIRDALMDWRREHR